MNIVHLEHPEGVIATLGGQTAINLAEPLARRGVRIIGTDCEGIEKAENRDAFDAVIKSLGIPNPQGEAVTDIESGVRAAERFGLLTGETEDGILYFAAEYTLAVSVEQSGFVFVDI